MTLARVVTLAGLILAARFAPADELTTLRQQVADLRNQVHQRGDANANWLLRQQLRELKTTVAMQELRIRQLEALVQGSRSDAPAPPGSGAQSDEVVSRLRQLCERTSWGEAVPAATCQQLGVEQQRVPAGADGSR